MQRIVRFPEVDIVRSAAVLGMIVYHLAYDLHVVYGYPIPVFSGWWWLLARVTAVSFLLLVGVSAVLAGLQEERPRVLRRKFLWRAVVIVACAGAVSIATYVVDPETYVRFGVLHLIALSVLVLPLFVRLRAWCAPIGFLVLFAGAILPEAAGTSLLLVFGIPPRGFASVDYFPMIPWFGVVMLGVALGQCLYGRRLQAFLPSNALSELLALPGRHALMIYMIHQPVLLAMLQVGRGMGWI